jgi:hypothetical protein
MVYIFNCHKAKMLIPVDSKVVYAADIKVAEQTRRPKMQVPLQFIHWPRINRALDALSKNRLTLATERSLPCAD